MAFGTEFLITAEVFVSIVPISSAQHSKRTLRVASCEKGPSIFVRIRQPRASIGRDDGAMVSAHEQRRYLPPAHDGRPFYPADGSLHLSSLSNLLDINLLQG